jgi:hypothetical protein
VLVAIELIEVRVGGSQTVLVAVAGMTAVEVAAATEPLVLLGTGVPVNGIQAVSVASAVAVAGTDVAVGGTVVGVGTGVLVAARVLVRADVLVAATVLVGGTVGVEVGVVITKAADAPAAKSQVQRVAQLPSR